MEPKKKYKQNPRQASQNPHRPKELKTRHAMQQTPSHDLTNTSTYLFRQNKAKNDKKITRKAAIIHPRLHYT